MDNTVGSLTQLQRSIILGSLLGDGYMRIVPGRANALLETNHTIAQKDYVDWKYEMLRSICRSGPVQRNGNGHRVAYRFTTRQHVELTDLYNLFYTDKKKHIPKDIKLDPIMLAVWYMDDGSRCGSSFYLNTQQFNSDDQAKCMKMLSDLGIESSLNKDKEYFRIRIKSMSLPRFFDLVNPYIVPSMKYKLKLSYNPVETYSERNRVGVLTPANTPPPIFSRDGMMI